MTSYEFSPKEYKSRRQRSASPSPEPTPLEAWVRGFDSERGDNGTPSIVSAYFRPTFIAATPQPPPTFQTQANFTIGPTIQSYESATVSSSTSTVLSTSFKQPDYFLTANLTKAQLDKILKRLCTEINWDWYTDNFANINCNQHSGNVDTWKLLCMVYEGYVQSILGHINIDESWQNEAENNGMQMLEFYRRVMHCMMLAFVDVNFAIQGKDRWRISEREKGRLEAFRGDLLEGRDILKYVQERARAVGLTYPGGTGRFHERLRMADVAKKNGWDIYQQRKQNRR
ncbi:hypothetical protein G7Y89_g4335 [Cudoniella acicularis]|uniref:Uncharacterized protein n=1 Tax=Cudoniella acicularis TaxID=354080 RepID=A0A8H4RR40_9HELO|nr:hypothetical protein G7Y89_g4335 [Cudoniella acicularis]